MNTASFIYALGWSVIHSLWQGALLCALAYALVPLFQLSAREKVNLLFSLLFTLFMAFAGTFWYYLPVMDVNASLNRLSLFNELRQVELTVANKRFSLEPYFPYISLAYAIGVFIQLMMLVFGYTRLWQLKRRATQPIPEAWQASLLRLLAEMRVRQRVACFLSEKVQVPMVLGLFKPVILFPVAAVSALDIAQVETILIHEINHVKRNDYVANIIKSLIETMLFFNPFVWILSRMLEREREHACDDQVLALTGTPLVYARALLTLESMRAKQLPTFALGAFHHKQYLLDRIKRMTIMKTTNLHARHKLAAMSLLVAGLAGLAWTNPIQEELPKAPDPVAAPMVREMPGPAVPPAAPLSVSRVLPTPPVPPTAPAILDTVSAKRDTIKIKIVPAKGSNNTSQNKKFNFDFDFEGFQAEVQKNAKEAQKEAAKIHAYFNSPEWKAYQEELTKNAAAIAATGNEIQTFFHSPEWKAGIKEMQEEAEQMGLSSITHDSAYFKSAEWKAKEKALKQQSQKLAALSMQFEQRFNSPEMKAKRAAWENKSEALRKQAELMQKRFESPEFKAHQDALRKKSEELRLKAEKFRAKRDSLDRD